VACVPCLGNAAGLTGYSVAGVFRFGSSGGTGYQKDAGRGAEPVNAGGRWQVVGGEVSE
jgi:hypothetical protein